MANNDRGSTLDDLDDRDSWHVDAGALGPCRLESGAANSSTLDAGTVSHTVSHSAVDPDTVCNHAVCNHTVSNHAVSHSAVDPDTVCIHTTDPSAFDHRCSTDRGGVDAPDHQC
ncbi:MAG: hypothetical protein ACR2QO_02450 [Acidimicrobiales bacterium]